MNRTDKLAYLPVSDLALLVRRREVSPVELVQTYLERIEQYDGVLRSYITVCGEAALREAREAERRVRTGAEIGPLYGVPLAIKDQFLTRGVRTTCGSRILAEFVPKDDATVVVRLREAGAILLGKLNMTEWATPRTIDFPFGQPRNPWDPRYDAGASSTGAGIAAAAGLCGGAIGEDTGGSIRGPASHNACVGLRPSWGRVSVHGVIEGSWSRDTAGPMARTVADCALIMNVIAGHDPQDPFSADLPVPDYVAALDGGIAGMRVGLVREMVDADFTDPEVRSAILEAASVLERLGAAVEEVSIPLIRLVGGVVTGAIGSERVATQWTYLKTRPHDYDAAVRRGILVPGLLPAALYQRALQAKHLLRQQVLEACERYDVLLSPTQAAPPRTIEATKQPVRTKEEALRQLRRFGFTSPFAVAGTPAISVPCGFSRKGLPMGLQVVGRRFDEVSVLRVAHAYEQATPWHAMHPPLG